MYLYILQGQVLSVSTPVKFKFRRFVECCRDISNEIIENILYPDNLKRYTHILQILLPRVKTLKKASNMVSISMLQWYAPNSSQNSKWGLLQYMRKQT